ncbi:HopJ type III effector protein [Endozoicomonas numazuensis]|uniref:Type III effector n=1 Tax=Endozoicomonas numazuensis TaxID=1137799 RepID=A0A081NKY4_9GAMM|nr:HopJ type III effector protein [Endozoicomonas numazuensis]KEQ19107.1 type III effector [Endozoicomonas numazuensis]
MTLNSLLQNIKTAPDSVEFEQVMSAINDHYEYTPVTFQNGGLINEAGTNEGSCKIFAFGLLNQLTEQETLSCFGHFYREDVLQNPEGESHGNIRNFMAHGWEGIQFDQQALKELK